MIAIAQTGDDLCRRLLSWEIEKILLDVLDLQRPLVQPGLFDQVFHGSVLYREGARDAVTVTDRPDSPVRRTPPDRRRPPSNRR